MDFQKEWPRRTWVSPFHDVAPKHLAHVGRKMGTIGPGMRKRHAKRSAWVGVLTVGWGFELQLHDSDGINPFSDDFFFQETAGTFT
jgi:hypothetical protein